MSDTRDESPIRLCELHGHVMSDHPDQIDAECPNHVCQRCRGRGVGMLLAREAPRPRRGVTSVLR